MKNTFILLLIFFSVFNAWAKQDKQQLLLDSLFLDATNQTWKEVFRDNFKSDWTKLWFLDGEKATIKNTPEGMYFYAGQFNRPSEKTSNPDHAVLWTKESFSGNIRIEYDYVRLDSANRWNVNILYLFAEGSGKDGFDKDIFLWKDLRKVPAMKMYYNHMNTYHISYAAFDDNGQEYLRARRYLPEKGGLKGTDLDNEYFDTGLFAPGVKHHIVVIRKGNYIFMKVTNSKQISIFYWDTNKFPPITSGRIGLRMMNYRGALYSNFKIYQNSR